MNNYCVKTLGFGLIFILKCSKTFVKVKIKEKYELWIFGELLCELRVLVASDRKLDPDWLKIIFYLIGKSRDSTGFKHGFCSLNDVTRNWSLSFSELRSALHCVLI